MLSPCSLNKWVGVSKWSAKILNFLLPRNFATGEKSSSLKAYVILFSVSASFVLSGNNKPSKFAGFIVIKIFCGQGLEICALGFLFVRFALCGTDCKSTRVNLLPSLIKQWITIVVVIHSQYTLYYRKLINFWIKKHLFLKPSYKLKLNYTIFEYHFSNIEILLILSILAFLLLV